VALTLTYVTSPRRGFGVASYKESAGETFIRGCPGVELMTPEDRSSEREPVVVKSRRVARMSFLGAQPNGCATASPD
jgi:hypothetical protein